MATVTEVDDMIVTGAHSFKPYARSLSHELRTPMHGVIGMLDVMHATVQEAIESQPNPKVRNIFQALKENIEVVQDSSRRAVEAADNIVHAYELNMQIPDTPMEEGGSPATFLSSSAGFESRPHIMIQGSNIVLNPRKRQKNSPVAWSFGSSTKRREVRQSSQRDVSPRSGNFHSASPPPARLEQLTYERAKSPSSPEPPRATTTISRSSIRESMVSDPIEAPGPRQSRVRDMIPIVIHEALRVGGRPDSSIGQPTELGEKIEVRTRSSSGHASYQIIEWSVQENVPEVLPIDERDLSKLISCVFLNAVKFTENGTISIVVSLSKSLRSVRINTIDTGAGIPKDFLPELFKPFSREDDSLTRTREGLGLGLLVAKGLARKLGGDLNLVHTETSGPRKGSEFEIKVPACVVGSGSKPGTPFDRTPTPSGNNPQPARSNTSFAPTPYSRPPLPTPHQSSSQPNLSTHHLPPTPSEPPSPTESRTHRSSSSRTPTRLSTRPLHDRHLAQKHPLTFLVAEDNRINRKLLVSMLAKLGYQDIYEAYDGREAVRLMREIAGSDAAGRSRGKDVGGDLDARRKAGTRPLKRVDVILMDLWMPEMDGYEATERILEMSRSSPAMSDPEIAGPALLAPAPAPAPTILAVSADVTEKAISRATAVGMAGFMTKPYKLVDLQRLIEEVCSSRGEGRGVVGS